MKKVDLIKLLNEIPIDKNLYSIDGELLPDRIILYQNYEKWEVFYFDERGNRNNLKVFENETEACNYIYNYFNNMKN